MRRMSLVTAARLVGCLVLAASLTSSADSARAEAPAPMPTCDGVPATIVGTDEADVLRGTPGDDVIVALNGADEITALGGDDLVCGGRGVDFIDLGFGDDTVWGGPDGFFRGLEGDQIIPGPGDDVVHGGPAPDEPVGNDRHEGRVLYTDAARAIDASLPGHGAEGTVVGQGHDVVEGIYSIVGTAYDDTIVAGAETDVVRGLEGDDTIVVDATEGEVYGGNGDDVLRRGWFVFGGRGDDRIVHAGNDAFGQDGDDLMVGTPDRNEFYAGAGNDRVRARGGRDYVLADRGDDVVLGGPGRDEVDGGRGDDRCRAEQVRACET